VVAIEHLAGRESSHHDTDLALLTAVWPLGADVPIPVSQQREMVERVERELLGARGVVRYLEDAYHVCHDGPPEWTVGLGFLPLAWNQLGDTARALGSLARLEATATESGELPEAWCRNPEHERYFNSPLCWSHALHVVAATELAALKAQPLPHSSWTFDQPTDPHRGRPNACRQAPLGRSPGPFATSPR